MQAMERHADPPSSLGKSLVACMVCRLVKSLDQVRRINAEVSVRTEGFIVVLSVPDPCLQRTQTLQGFDWAALSLQKEL